MLLKRKLIIVSAILILTANSVFTNATQQTGTQDGKTLFAANRGSNTIAVVDMDKRQIINTIKVGKDPYGAVLTPDGKHVHSGNLGDNSISEIDVATMQVSATINGFK